MFYKSDDNENELNFFSNKNVNINSQKKEENVKNRSLNVNNHKAPYDQSENNSIQKEKFQNAQRILDQQREKMNQINRNSIKMINSSLVKNSIPNLLQSSADLSIKNISNLNTLSAEKKSDLSIKLNVKGLSQAYNSSNLPQLISSKQNSHMSNTSNEVKKEIQEEEKKEDKIEVDNYEDAEIVMNNQDESNQQLINVFNAINSIPPLHTEMEFLEEFLIEPLPKGYTLMCNITRKRSGIDKIYPKYYCTVLKSEKFLMAARKRPNNTTPNYLITMSFDNFEKTSVGFLGKLRSNFMGTEFSIYDTGKNPSDAQNIHEKRKQLAQITYESNFFGMNGPRKMKVYIPLVNENTREVFPFRPSNDDESLISNYVKGNKNILELSNKQPVWSEKHKSFILNFNGRIEKGSVKNFQLIDENDVDTVYMQFGRISDDLFAMDFQFPLSPIQAFGIALSSLDRKFACE